MEKKEEGGLLGVCCWTRPQVGIVGLGQMRGVEREETWNALNKSIFYYNAMGIYK